MQCSIPSRLAGGSGRGGYNCGAPIWFPALNLILYEQREDTPYTAIENEHGNSLSPTWRKMNVFPTSTAISQLRIKRSRRRTNLLSNRDKYESAVLRHTYRCQHPLLCTPAPPTGTHLAQKPLSHTALPSLAPHTLPLPRHTQVIAALIRAIKHVKSRRSA